MPAYNFNSQQFDPQYGGSGKMLPPCKKTKVMIVDSRQEPTKDGRGGYLALDLRVVEGPLAGREQTDRLNLHNVNAQTVEIANKQLSAYCHVTGVYAFTATEQLHNIPFLIDVDWQKGNEPSAEKPEGGYTHVTALYDVNGNPPGKAGQGRPSAPAPVAPVAPPPANVQPMAPQPWQQNTQPAPAVANGWGNR